MLLFQTTFFFRKPLPLLFTAVLALFMASCQESPPPPPESETVKATPTAGRTKVSVSPEQAEKLIEQQEQSAKLIKGPSFPGGAEGLATYMEANLKYPEQEKKDGITEQIFMNFFVQADGTISNIENLNGENQNLIDASIAIVENMPKWEPAIGEDGEPAKASFWLPIDWKLKDAE